MIIKAICCAQNAKPQRPFLLFSITRIKILMMFMFCVGHVGTNFFKKKKNFTEKEEFLRNFSNNSFKKASLY
jgi:hypothetical protein